MNDHRDPPDSVSNDLPRDNPRPVETGAALEQICTTLLRLEPLTYAAATAVAQLPQPEGADDRRPLERATVLIARVADEVRSGVAYTYELIEAGTVSAILRPEGRSR